MLKNLVKEKNWIFYENNLNTQKLIQQKYNIPPFVANAVLNRENEDTDSFINLDETSLEDPFCLNGMNNAVSAIKDAVKNMKTIIVYGDYDVDGITSTYMLVHYIRLIGGCVSYYIPSRMSEGYGLNERALLNLKEKGADLIITVDLGITAIKEAKLCKQIGLDLIITDHHIPPEGELPDCIAVINPKVSDNYSFKHLAGAGVAFKLICALSDMDKAVFDYYIQFASIGTISDLVELKGENRFITKHGLSKIKNTTNIGLLSLLKIAGIDTKKLTSSSVSFGIAPRLNAAGRLSSADISVELLLCKDNTKADEIALFLEQENTKRKDEELKIFHEADEIIISNELYKDDIIVVSGKNWHHGVVGIVSSKITEKYYKPSIVISTDDENTGKASGRSIEGFNLFDAIKHCGDLLDKYGGHALAAGLSIEKDKIDEFRLRINDYAKDYLTDEILTPSVKIDDIINISDINLNTVIHLKTLEPYGTHNPTAVFCLKNLKIVSTKITENNLHSFLTLTDSQNSFMAPAFNLKDKTSLFEIGETVDICGSINQNNYNNKSYAQFIIKDIRPSRKMFFTKDDLRKLYILIKNKEFTNASADMVLQDFYATYHIKIGFAKLYRMLMVMTELDMIYFEISDKDIITIAKTSNFDKKTELLASITFNTYSE